jgi:hypothetical protein
VPEIKEGFASSVIPARSLDIEFQVMGTLDLHVAISYSAAVEVVLFEIPYRPSASICRRQRYLYPATVLAMESVLALRKMKVYWPRWSPLGI